LIELQRRRKRFAQFVENGDFARFALFVLTGPGAAAFHATELFCFAHKFA